MTVWTPMPSSLSMTSGCRSRVVMAARRLAFRIWSLLVDQASLAMVLLSSLAVSPLSAKALTRALESPSLQRVIFAEDHSMSTICAPLNWSRTSFSRARDPRAMKEGITELITWPLRARSRLTSRASSNLVVAMASASIKGMASRMARSRRARAPFTRPAFSMLTAAVAEAGHASTRAVIAFPTTLGPSCLAPRRLCTQPSSSCSRCPSVHSVELTTYSNSRLSCKLGSQATTPLESPPDRCGRFSTGLLDPLGRRSPLSVVVCWLGTVAASGCRAWSLGGLRAGERPCPGTDAVAVYAESGALGEAVTTAPSAQRATSSREHRPVRLR
mmetsp:Transcript_54822/g.97568  ORF Transcript_54822/g.97568 Transcript_54822/m.97568 type:complete len:329 (-) Transcript_54822:107-1093(-)